jgi:putative ABC transport system permease protein
MGTFWQDLHYSLRLLVKAPGFAIIVILALGLGIGTSTAIFSVADAVLLRPLPYPNSEQLVRIWEQSRKGSKMNLAYSNFEDFNTQNSIFSSLAKFEYRATSITGGSEPVRVNVASVSATFFKTLGVDAYRGRLFTSDEQHPGGTPAIVVSYGFWQRYLGNTTDFSGLYVRMDQVPYQVVGVMPMSFDFPPDTAGWISSELQPASPSRRSHNWRVIGRLGNGITLAQARVNLSIIAGNIKREYGNKVDLDDVAVVSLAESTVGNVRAALLTLLGAVGLLFLVAYANVAGLLLARSYARRKELAIRATLGARRGHFLQQFLTEAVVLSVPGGLLGIVIACLGVKLFPAILPASLPRQAGIEINAAVLLFALAITIVVTILLGLSAAWRAGAGDLQGGLAAGSRVLSGSAISQRLRGFFVIGEIAMTFMILVVAGLLGRSFVRLISTNPGFQGKDLITMEFSLPIPPRMLDQADVARQVQVLDRLTAGLRAIRGAESVGMAGALPVAAGDNLADGDFLVLNGQQPPANSDELVRAMNQNRSQLGHALYAVVDEGYFHALGIPLVRGRLFNDQDWFNTPNVALVSQTLAQTRWPDQDPIGQTIEYGNMDGNLQPLTVVGIVGDVRARGLDAPSSAVVYVDYRQRGMNPNSSPIVLVRSTVPEGEMVSAARGVFHNTIPDVPLKFSTFEAKMGGWLADRRFLLVLVGAFGTAALVLGALGIYGVVTFSVTRRIQEVGIRMALGAQRGDILRLILGEGVRMAAFGIAIGIGLSLAITRLMSTLVFGISTTDPLAFAVTAVLLCLVALAASCIPALRALQIDPLTALRYS